VVDPPAETVRTAAGRVPAVERPLTEGAGDAPDEEDSEGEPAEDAAGESARCDTRKAPKRGLLAPVFAAFAAVFAATDVVVIAGERSRAEAMASAAAAMSV
jgi:hypothetical protein